MEAEEWLEEYWITGDDNEAKGCSKDRKPNKKWLKPT